SVVLGVVPGRPGRRIEEVRHRSTGGAGEVREAGLDPGHGHVPRPRPFPAPGDPRTPFPSEFGDAGGHGATAYRPPGERARSVSPGFPRGAGPHRGLLGFPPLELLRAFVAGGRCMNVTAAARELAITQPALSRQIRALEEALGCALFERRHRGLEFTPE